MKSTRPGLFIGACLLLAVAFNTAGAEPFDASRMPVNEPVFIREMSDVPDDLRGLWTRCTNTKLDDSRPIELHRIPDGSVVALVPCRRIVAMSELWLMRGWPRSPPQRMALPAPYRAGTGGFAMTQDFGLLRWNAEAGTLVSTMGSDMCPDLIWRTTYDIPRGSSSPFRLSKVESALRSCGNLETPPWQIEWEAGPWRERPKIGE